MTTEIELPPLPEPTGVKVGQSHVYMHTHDAMYAYARAAVLADREKRAQGAAPPQDAKSVEHPLHPATADLVRRFTNALASKLSMAEQKYGYSDGWRSGDWMDECREELLAHVAKGDPRDVAAYCAFLWHHGERTAAPQPQAPSSDDVRDQSVPDDDCVICPGCAHQFQAIPVNVQVALVEQHVRAELVKAQPQQELQAAQTAHWEGCEQSHPECAAKIGAAIRVPNEGDASAKDPD
jgi:hypothetical protein